MKNFHKCGSWIHLKKDQNHPVSYTNRINKNVCIVLFLLIPVAGMAEFKPKSLQISLVNEAISMPFRNPIILPLHPGISVGSDLWSTSRGNWKQSSGAELLWYYHRLFENAFILDGYYSIGYRLRFGLHVKAITEMGYKHSVLSGMIYRLDDGVYKKTVFPGKAQFNAKIGLGLEYSLNPRYSLTTEYLSMIVLPYAPERYMPFALHSLFTLGLKINFSEKQN
jgi:hypothetical protein